MLTEDIINEVAQGFEGPGVDFGEFKKALEDKGVKIISCENFNAGGNVNTGIHYYPTDEDKASGYVGDYEGYAEVKWCRPADGRFVDYDATYRNL